jgi:hypothetical protein
MHDWRAHASQFVGPALSWSLLILGQLNASSPTTTNADWISLDGIPGTDGTVYSLAVDATGNLCAGGEFSVAGRILASDVAMWDGNVWTNLGHGIRGTYNNGVRVVAADNVGNVYAGGDFALAGNITVTNIAMWTGSVWTNRSDP